MAGRRASAFFGVLLACASCVNCSELGAGLAFFETFDTDAFASGKWLKSSVDKYSDQTLKIGGVESAPEGFQDDQAVTLLEGGSRYYAFGTVFPEPIDNTDKGFVVQYDVKLDDGLSCGGAYVKLLRSENLDFSVVDDKTPYAIMFGPDKCGSTNKVHFILQHQNPITGVWEEKHFKDAPLAKTDKKTHLYTLSIKPDNSFEIYIDKKLSKSGNLLSDMNPSVNPEELIDDPEDKKPTDWVDEAKIPEPGATKPDDWDESAPLMIEDPNATKPSGWLDNEPDSVPDPEAAKPEDWDDEEDGEWEAPLVPNPKCQSGPGCGKWTPPKIKNPDYKGKWKAPMIDNPDYKGVWAPRKIPNPAYFLDEHPHNLPKITGLAVEVMTLSPNIHFDNFVVGYDLDAALAFADTTFVLKSTAETTVEEKKQKEEKIKEREEKKAEGGITNLVEVYAAEALDFVKEHLLATVATAVVALASLLYLCFRGGKSAPVAPAEEKEEEEEEDEPTKPDGIEGKEKEAEQPRAVEGK